MFERNERLTELIQQQVSELLPSVKDPGLSGFITLTGVTLRKDRKHATIFYSILGSDEDRRSAAKALERAAAYLRFQLKSRLTLKYIPELAFEYDRTPERAHRVDAVLERIKAEAAAEAAGSGRGPQAGASTPEDQAVGAPKKTRSSSSRKAGGKE